MKITHCCVNHLQNPLGYYFAQPTFTWQVEEAAGKQQLDARLIVAQDSGLTAVVLDTGFAELDSLGVTPQLDLAPRTRYYWTVTVRTTAGEEAASPVQWFETAKMDEPWQAQWITCDENEPRCPVFSYTLPLQKPVQSARLYICGLGLYEAYLNGERVGDEYLTPYCNDYHLWLQYQTYDVTAALQKGGDFRVLLGGGWYGARFGLGLKPDSPAWISKKRQLIAEFRVTYTDGSTDVFGTEPGWAVTRSTITGGSIYDGEYADATLPERPAERAEACDAPAARLMERLSPPVHIQETLAVKELLHTPAGENVLDLGQNHAGIFLLRVDLPRGAVVHLQFGELLQDGNFYRGNLRSALQEYCWVSDGKPAVLQPHFTYYGYRFVKVEGVPNLKAEDYTALVLYSDIPAIGSIVTGNALVNRLIQNAMWGQKSNFVDVPTDCPQRDERMGWTADAQVFCGTATYLTETYPFYRKYLYDMALEQAVRGGKAPEVVPAVNRESTCSVWGDATCIMPWVLYLQTGDAGILAEHYEAMRSWIGYIASVDGDDCCWRKIFHFGDWLALDGHPEGKTGVEANKGGTDDGFIADVYYRNSVILTAKSARVLGHDADAEALNAQADALLARIRRDYYTADGHCRIRTQTAQVLTIFYALTDDPAIAAKDLAALLAENGGKLTTGFVGAPLLCRVLSAQGIDKTAYDLLLNEEYPGWLYAVKLGATTIWERWNSVMPDGHVSSTGMNSMNHYSYGSIVEWLWRWAAGLQPVGTAPGFRKVVLTPRTDPRLGHLDAVCRTAAGTYAVHWRYQQDGTLHFAFTVPFGCEAELSLPNVPQGRQFPKTLTAGSYEFSDPPAE